MIDPLNDPLFAGDAGEVLWKRKFLGCFISVQSEYSVRVHYGPVSVRVFSVPFRLGVLVFWAGLWAVSTVLLKTTLSQAESRMYYVPTIAVCAGGIVWELWRSTFRSKTPYVEISAEKVTYSRRGMSVAYRRIVSILEVQTIDETVVGENNRAERNEIRFIDFAGSYLFLLCDAEEGGRYLVKILKGHRPVSFPTLRVALEPIRQMD